MSINIAWLLEQQQRVQDARSQRMRRKYPLTPSATTKERMTVLLGKILSIQLYQYYWQGYAEGLKKYWSEKLNRPVHTEL
jgi:hypothetical protein